MAGADAGGTYGVMMRERAEMVVRVQTGEVSGVSLHTNEAVSALAVCFYASHMLYKPATLSNLQCVCLCVPNL